MRWAVLAIALTGTAIALVRRKAVDIVTAIARRPTATKIITSLLY